MANKKFTNPINRGRIVANKFEVTDVTGNEKIIKDIDSNVNVQGTKLDANFFTELQKGLVFTVDSVHSVESRVDIYTLAIDGLYGNSNTAGFPLFNGLSLNIKIDISNTETASKIRISDSDYTFLKENGNTYSALNVGELIENNYYRVIYNGSEFILSNTTKATETTNGISKIATQTEVDAGIEDSKIVTSKKLKKNLTSGVQFLENGYKKNLDGTIEQWGINMYLGSSSSGGTIVSFPITFPNKCVSIVAVDGGGQGCNSIGVVIIDKSKFRCWGRNVSSGAFSDSTVSWRAIGY